MGDVTIKKTKGEDNGFSWPEAMSSERVRMKLSNLINVVKYPQNH